MLDYQLSRRVRRRFTWRFTSRISLVDTTMSIRITGRDPNSVDVSSFNPILRMAKLTELSMFRVRDYNQRDFLVN